MKQTEKIVCPYCGSEKITTEGDRYHCTECDWLFDDDDIIREDLRHKISAHLMGTTEESPRELDITIGESDAVGLSSLELPQVVGAFHDYEAVIWFNVYGVEEPIEFDNMQTEDLQKILNFLES